MEKVTGYVTGVNGNLCLGKILGLRSEKRSRLRQDRQ